MDVVVFRRFMAVSLAEGWEMSVKGAWGRRELDGRGEERVWRGVLGKGKRFSIFS
uniref:Uncharacterized protein n=1 Tax=Solanum tuberosum TaxID=4113 RepID=M1AZR9_SOLTU